MDRAPALALMLAHGADPEISVDGGERRQSLKELALERGNAEMVRMVREALEEKERGGR